MKLPNRIFFTGVPGSRWSGIAQTLETLPIFNISDRTPTREYVHHNFSGHKGSYFGRGMELEPILDSKYIDSAWGSKEGVKLVKSHDWAFCLSELKEKFPDDWIMLVYRPDLVSYSWWHEAGGFQIKYPNYSEYKDSVNMLAEIQKQNKCILEYAYTKNAVWEYFTSTWIEKHFKQSCKVEMPNKDILVSLIY